MSLFIVTFTPHFKKNVIRELVSVDELINVKGVFSDSIVLVASTKKPSDFIDGLIKKNPIFIKQIMPVMKTGKIKGKLDTDKQILHNATIDITNMTKGKEFAVQCRIVDGKLDYSAKDIEVFLGQYFYQKGLMPSFSDNELRNEDIDIVSILINKDNYYLGFSNSKENLNSHSDEYRICSKEGRKISRAENKLKEALVKFDITLDGKGIALDVGAAPGGWSKVLIDYEFKVIAVDPSELHPDLQQHPRLKHFKCRIEKLNFNNYFDIIVNDMNIEPVDTAKIMNSLSAVLKEDGIAIVTLKLPKNPEEAINKAKKILNEQYDVLKIKSLFHNRQEVTVLIKKRIK